jgi:ankyrin repeat protein
VELLLDEGYHVNLADQEGCTALHIPSARGHKSVVRRLLAGGADMDKADKNGKTPLLSSCGRSSDKRIVHVLIEGGADVKTADKDGNTPLHAECAYGDGTVMNRLL